MFWFEIRTSVVGWGAVLKFHLAGLAARGAAAWAGVVAAAAAAIGWARLQARSEPLPSRPLVLVAACVAAGCLAGRLVPLVPGFESGPWRTSSLAVAWWWSAMGALAVWGTCLRRGRPWAAAASLGAAIGCTAAAWSAARFDLFPGDDLAWQFESAQVEAGMTPGPVPVAVVGIVLESPRLLPSPVADPRQAAAIGPSSEFILAVQRLRDGGRWRDASGRAAVIVDGDPPPVAVGSRVRIFGRGLRPAAALNPGEFDFRLRARTSRCLSIIRVHAASCIRILAEPPWWAVGPAIDRLRARGVGTLHEHVSSSRAPLAAALLLGSRESLPRQDADDFLVTGTVHILSISGLHVGLLAFALFRICRWLLVPRGWALVTVAACTGLYMLLVRAETPVVRATLLVWLACLGAATGRRSPAVNALAVAAVVILACRPGEVFGAGAQLSFMSTAVLVAVSAALARPRAEPDPIERLIDRSRSPAEKLVRRLAWNVWVLFVTGAAVWAVSAPLVGARFHVLSPIGLVLNVLIAPFVALAMGWGLACLLTAGLSPAVAGLCGAACDGALACIGGLVSWAADVPGGHVWLAAPPCWWVAGWYAVLAAVCFWLPAERLARARTWGVVTAAWIAIGLAGCGLGRLAEPGVGPLRMVMAAVGHGCGIVVRSPSGRCLVYDAGRLGAPAAARRALAGVLWSEGLRRIDTLVISHADADHFNAVPQLLERFAVGEVLITDDFPASRSSAVTDLLEQIYRRGIPLRTVRAGEEFAIDPQCRVRVLHPAASAADIEPAAGPADSDAAEAGAIAADPQGGRALADNERSIVLAVESAGRRLLLPGDLEGEALDRFVAAGPDRCDVLVAPHHGSRSSLPPDIARATAPTWILVSGQGGAGWPEVRAAYGAASTGGVSRVLKTGGEGAIAVEATAAGVGVRRFSRGAWQLVAPGEGSVTAAACRSGHRAPASRIVSARD
jgi:competence protein ComEC